MLYRYCLELLSFAALSLWNVYAVLSVQIYGGLQGSALVSQHTPPTYDFQNDALQAGLVSINE